VTCAVGEPCRQVLEVVGVFASNHCIVALEAVVKIVVPKGVVVLAHECFCRLSIVSIYVSTRGHSPRVLCYGVKTKVVVWEPNQLFISKICCAAADNFVYKLSKGKNAVGARYSRSLGPPFHQGTVVDMTLVF
jgi:hypothetical protein